MDGENKIGFDEDRGDKKVIGCFWVIYRLKILRVFKKNSLR